MTWSFLTDEHVPSVFITSLSSAGYDVVTVRSVLEAGAADRDVLEYAAANGLVLITNDRSDFAETVSAERPHPGIVIYTDRTFLVDDPEVAVQTIERAFSYIPAVRTRERDRLARPLATRSVTPATPTAHPRRQIDAPAAETPRP